jgi:hypothetical protein
MSAARTTPLFCAALIAAGAGLWASQIPGLEAEGALNFEPNPLGLKRSAYGEVIAMALQGPIDEEWTSGVIGRRIYREEATASTEEAPAEVADGGGGGARLASFLRDLNRTSEIRTNPRGASEAHKRAIRRSIENRLKFAYEFDPANFGNYNSYHFFITQPQLATRPVLTQQALDLANATIRYCESRSDDPRPALTAAAAAENILQLMFENSDKYQKNLPQMRQLLGIMDRNLARYRLLATRWENDGIWQALSSMRQIEAEERYQLTVQLRTAAQATIKRLEQQAAADQANR